LTVHCVKALDTGDGPTLYAGGEFQSCGNVRAAGIAARDIDGWRAIAPRMGYVDIHELAAFDDGSGAVILAGGYVRLEGAPTGLPTWLSRTGIWRLSNGEAQLIAPVWNGVNRPLRVKAIVPFESNLYVAGNFAYIENTRVESIACWNGQYWAPLAGGVSNPENVPGLYGWVNALAIYDDGGGSALYAGGRFTRAGGVPVQGIAKWDGLQWHAVGTLDSDDCVVLALATADFGEGLRLFAGGDIATVGGVAVSNLAAWDGQQWHDVGGGVGNGVGAVYALKAAMIENAPQLFVGGSFGSAGPLQTEDIARWDGAAWHAVGGGMSTTSSGTVYSIEVFDDGDGPAIWLGGDFESTSAGVSLNIARFGCVRDDIAGDLNCDGSVNAYDIDAFVLALQDAARYAETYPDCRIQNADTNADGAVNNFDIDPFVMLLAGD
ncbi:MAG: hypothetical protein JNG88_15965, partial [Phycisphaerales bacterium]|nr:hypothetical protein [Phycisphaerales bacterium]